MIGLILHDERDEHDDVKEIWVHSNYSSLHQILVVGDGDFSFSLSLATSFRSALNITATSLDSYDILTKNYKKVRSNLESLQKLGASVIHGVDATRMKDHTDLRMRRFDRIIYNFPHAGFRGKEANLHVIENHRGLVRAFFHNASSLLRSDGEIHVTHKTSAPFCNWNLEELAKQNFLELIESAPFKIEDYPGYNNKRGDGTRSDAPFPLGECSTFKFVLMPSCKKTISRTIGGNWGHVGVQPQWIQNSVKHYTNTYGNSGYNLVSFGAEHLAVPDRRRFGEECRLIFDWYFVHVRNTFGLPDRTIDYNVHKALRIGYDRFVNIASGRPLSDFICFLEEMHRLSNLKIERLKRQLRDMP